MFGVEFSVISSIFSSSYRKFLHCILPHLPVSVPLCVVHLCVFTTPCGYFSHLLFYFEVICLYCVMFNFTYPSCLMVFDYLYLSLFTLQFPDYFFVYKYCCLPFSLCLSTCSFWIWISVWCLWDLTVCILDSDISISHKIFFSIYSSLITMYFKINCVFHSSNKKKTKQKKKKKESKWA